MHRLLPAGGVGGSASSVVRGAGECNRDAEPGPDSTLWIESYDVSPDAAPFGIVIGANGAVEATVELLPGHRLRAVGMETMAVTTDDADTGVEAVVVFRSPPYRPP